MIYNEWFKFIKDIDLCHIFIYDLIENINELDNFVKNNKIDYIFPLYYDDYNMICEKTTLKNITMYVNDEVRYLLDNKVIFTKYMMINYPDNIPEVFYLDDLKIGKKCVFLSL
jgi:hypothetical protein